MNRNRVSVSGAGGSGAYFFDRAFAEATTQDEVCDYINDRVLPHALNGEHICLLAYGQTGSGKTYTMFGDMDVGAKNQGVAFRAVNRLAIALRERTVPATIEFSFLEVYNDELYDLLNGSSGNAQRLPKQRSAEKFCVPQGLVRRHCELENMEDQVHGWLREGAATRTVGRTVFNARSSRSHGVVLLHICWRSDGSASRLGVTTSSSRETRIYIVDLAGSERAGLYAIGPEQLKEGEQINLSLSALGRVVSALAQGGGKASQHVPYRDSALTWLLKDAITGTNARVCMVAAVTAEHAVETASTLRYANQYSKLGSNTNSGINGLAAEVAEQKRAVDHLLRAVETAMAGDEYSIAWTRESLKGTVQPVLRAKELTMAHPYLEWTPAHQTKQNVRGNRKDRGGVGRSRNVAEVPPPRGSADASDGRRASDANGRRASDDGLPPDRSVEVVFEGKHGRPPVVLWYPETALEVVQPPKNLVDAMAKLEQAEDAFALKKAEYDKAKGEKQQEEKEWMAQEC